MNEKLIDGTKVSVWCPRCNPQVKLVIRTNRQSETQFLACSNWPECKYTQHLPVDLALKSQGALSLPGFFESLAEKEQ